MGGLVQMATAWLAAQAGFHAREKHLRLFGISRDAPQYLAVRRKVELIPPCIYS
jgi:hypothetical protein